MSEAARLIRGYLDKQGGSTEARVHHLLSTFEVEDEDAAGRERIVAELGEENIHVDPPLEGLGQDDQVVLSAPSRPASERPAPSDIDDQTRAAFMSPAGAEPSSDPPEKRRRRWSR